jgi:hypothetical protein
LDNLVEEQRRAREDAEERTHESTTKTIGGVFGEQGELWLLRLCQVANSNMLPTIYQALADAPKASRLQTLQDAMDEVAETISYVHTHIAMPSLLKKVMALQYVIVDPDHLEDGIHHFTVTRQTPTQQQQLRQRAVDYGLLLASDGNPALTDVRAYGNG